VIKSWEAAKRDRKQMKQKERKRDSKKEEKHRHHDGWGEMKFMNRVTAGRQKPKGHECTRLIRRFK